MEDESPVRFLKRKRHELENKCGLNKEERSRKELAYLRRRARKRIKNVHGGKYRAVLQAEKEAFESLIESVVDKDNKNAQDYLNVMRRMSLEDLLCQVRELMAPFVRLGFTRKVVLIILKRMNTKEGDLYFHCDRPLDDSEEKRNKEAKANYLLMVRYIEFLVREADNLMSKDVKK